MPRTNNVVDLPGPKQGVSSSTGKKLNGLVHKARQFPVPTEHGMQADEEMMRRLLRIVPQEQPTAHEFVKVFRWPQGQDHPTH